jgi:hypothetical protein
MRTATIFIFLATLLPLQAFSCVICTMRQQCVDAASIGFTSCGFSLQTGSCINNYPKCGNWAGDSFWYWDSDSDDETFWDPDSGLDGDNFSTPAQGKSTSSAVAPVRTYSISALPADVIPMVARAPRLASVLWNAIVFSKDTQIHSFEYVTSGASRGTSVLQSLVREGLPISSAPEIIDSSNQTFIVHLWTRGETAIAVTVYESPAASAITDGDTPRILTAFFYPVSTSSPLTPNPTYVLGRWTLGDLSTALKVPVADVASKSAAICQ